MRNDRTPVKENEPRRFLDLGKYALAGAERQTDVGAREGYGEERGNFRAERRRKRQTLAQRGSAVLAATLSRLQAQISPYLPASAVGDTMQLIINPESCGATTCADFRTGRERATSRALGRTTTTFPLGFRSPARPPTPISVLFPPWPSSSIFPGHN